MGEAVTSGVTPKVVIREHKRAINPLEPPISATVPDPVATVTFEPVPMKEVPALKLSVQTLLEMEAGRKALEKYGS